MVPDGVMGQPLRFFLTEYLLMSSVLRRDSLYWLGLDSLRMEDDSPDVVFTWPSCPRDVPLPRDKRSPHCIVGS